MDNLVEIDDSTIRDFGGSLYVLLPKRMRQGIDGVPVEKGDKAIFLRAPNDSDTVIRIQKPTPSSSNGLQAGEEVK